MFEALLPHCASIDKVMALILKAQTESTDLPEVLAIRDSDCEPVFMPLRARSEIHWNPEKDRFTVRYAADKPHSLCAEAPGLMEEKLAEHLTRWRHRKPPARGIVCRDRNGESLIVDLLTVDDVRFEAISGKNLDRKTPTTNSPAAQEGVHQDL